MQNCVFLCSLDDFLLEYVIVFFYGNKISKWRSFEKRAVFDLLFTLFNHQGKDTKIIQHISHLYTRILLTLMTFLLSQLLPKKIPNLSCMLVRLLVLTLICEDEEEEERRRKLI